LSNETDAYLRSNKLAEAEAACRQLALLLAEWNAGEGGAESQDFLAAAFFDLGGFYRALKKKDEAEKAYEQALKTWQALLSAHPGDARIIGHIAGCKNHLGLLYQDTGSLQQATDFFQQAVSLREGLLKSHPEDDANVVYLGGAMCNLGNIAAQRNELETALAWYHRSIDMLDRSIPGCDCGCRDMHANLLSHA